MTALPAAVTIVATLVALALPGGRALAQAGTADTVIVAELVRIDGGWVACGRVHQIGAVEYRVLRVERGELRAERLVVEVSCPGMSWRPDRVSRLHLRTRRPGMWPGPRPGGLPSPPAERRYLVRQEHIATEPGYGALLGRQRATIERSFEPTGEDDGWVHYGDGVAILYEGGRAARVKARIPGGLSSTAITNWLGFDRVRWLERRRRRGVESGRFSHSGGALGSVADGWAEVWRAPG